MTIRGKGAWALIIVFVLSLGLNVFGIGALYAWRHAGAGHFAHAGAPVMDRETRKQARPYFKAALREHRPELRAAGDRVREARDNVATLMKGEEIDRAQLDAALTDLRTATGSAHEAFQDAMVDAALAMPAELRQRVDWRRLNRHRRGKRHGRGGRDGRDGGKPAGEMQGQPE